MLRSFNKKSACLLFWITAITSAMFCLVILLSVSSRFIFKLPVASSVELSRLFFLWACFGAAAVGYHRKAHIALSFITDRLPKIWLKTLEIVTYTISLIFFSILFIEALRVISILWDTSLPMLGWTQAHLYIPMAVSMFFIILFTLEFLTDALWISTDLVKEDALDTHS